MSSTAAFRPYEFRQPPQLPLSTWITLQRWRDSLVARASDSWNRRLSAAVEVSVSRAESVLARDLEHKLADPGWGAELHVGPERFSTMFASSQRQMLALCRNLLGAVDSEWPAEQPLSVVEESLAKLLVRDLADASSEGWPGDVPLVVEPGESLPRPVRSRMFPAHQRVLICGFQIRSSPGVGAFWWVFPETELVRLLTACQHNASPDSSPLPSAEMPELVERLPVELVVELGNSRLTMAQLAGLSEGDLLILKQRVSDPIRACLGGRPKFQGWPGRIGVSRAFQIEAEKDESERGTVPES